ncbi:hypothetical protein EV421DRAFT_1907980 [Armillaria borealis]|uniref:Protein kinase domain-containing protein n=1 Tax=Armillaria borealis TaxID=47425 RepID=A0AA39J6I0_9AGAR|nr:hypothetical protein EV421DRAFT_1907980 [Armillaria borealis]
MEDQGHDDRKVWNISFEASEASEALEAFKDGLDKVPEAFKQAFKQASAFRQAETSQQVSIRATILESIYKGRRAWKEASEASESEPAIRPPDCRPIPWVPYRRTLEDLCRDDIESSTFDLEPAPDYRPIPWVPYERRTLEDLCRDDIESSNFDLEVPPFCLSLLYNDTGTSSPQCFASGCGSGFEFLHDELDRDDILNNFNWNVISDNLNLNDILRYFNPYDFLSSLCSIIQGGFDSNKFQNPPKIMKYIKPPSKTVLHVSDARTKHGISLPARSGLPSFMEQRAAFEAILTTFEESRGHAQQCLVDNTNAPRSSGYVLLPEKLSPRQQWFQSTPRVPYYERADSERRYRVVLEKYQAAEERYRVAGEQYQAAEEPYRRVSKERKQAAEEWYAAAEERYQAVEELFQAASEQYEVALRKYKTASKRRCRVNSLQRYEAVSWRYETASERQCQVTWELKVRPLMGCSPPIRMGWYSADMDWYQATGREWYQAASKRYQAASAYRYEIPSRRYQVLSRRYRVLSRRYQGTLEQWCRAAEEQCRAAKERCRATSKRYQAAKQEYEAASKLECPADSQQQDKAKQRYQKALKWCRVASEQQYQATLERRYRATEKRWHAAEEQYQAAEEQYQVVEKRYEAAEGQWQAASAQYHGTVKQVVSTLVLVSWYLQETLEDIRSAFEDFQAAFKQLPRVHLNPPPIFLRVVGPISMDLRPFHRGKNMYSLGSMFLESLMCDFWISWDLRSYEVLVAAKIIHKGRLYPAAFTSKLSLLVKRLIKANLQFALQSYDKGRRQSTGLGVSTTPTFRRAGHDALIKGAVEGSSMQRSLIATISLGVRNLTSCITPIGERPECFGGFAEIWGAQLTSSNGKLSVAVKYLRLCVTEVTKHLYREIRIWQSLEHPHVLPLLGICYNANTYESIRASGEHIVDPMVSIGIVCPWMVNGTLVDYLKHRQTKAENIELRLRLLIQVCSGLMYLHSKNIVHGDLHGGNVLVDSEGCARLADFGLSAVVAECRGTSRTSPGGISSPHGGALRWAAPELFLPGGAEARLHTSADIYSIGGLILQACTGGVPYSYYNEPRVLGAIIAGEKPRRPTSDEANISDALWSMIEECWQDDPLERPTAAALKSRLQAIYSGLGGEQA